MYSLNYYFPTEQITFYCIEIADIVCICFVYFLTFLEVKCAGYVRQKN